MIHSSRRSRPFARISRRFARPSAVVALALLMIAALVPAAAAADRTPAPERPSGGTVIPARVDLGVAVFPVPAGAIGIQSFTGYSYEDGTVAVVGEVLNNASTRRGTVVVEATYYNASDVVIGTDTEVVLLDRVSRGAVGPFLLYDEEPPSPGCDEFGQPAGCIDSVSVRAVSSIAVTAPPAGALEILGPSSSFDGDVRRFEGTIRNPNTFAVTGVFAMVTAYDAEGNVVDVTYHNLGSLAAGASAPYEMVIAEPQPPIFYHHGMVVADGFRSGQTSSYVTSWSNYFDDLFGSQFRADIVWLAEAGFTSGCGTGLYCPTAVVTRGQMASFLSRALGLPATATDYFTDDNTSSHESSINRVAEAGITSGCGGTKYCPTAVVTRGQMASFLSRALGLPATATDYFSDDNTSSHQSSINRVAEAGITSGCGGTKYCPTAAVTRGQMAAFLRRAFE